MAGELQSVLVVDDSAFMRRMISDIIAADSRFEVVGTANDGAHALKQVALLDPDIVTLDVDMPVMDGFQTLDAIMSTKPRAVVMLSAAAPTGTPEPKGAGSAASHFARLSSDALCGRAACSADTTLAALERGAVDFVRKPSGSISLDMELVRDRLLEALSAAGKISQSTLLARLGSGEHVHFAGGQPRLQANMADSARPQALTVAPSFVVVMAASTGGPAVLAKLARTLVVPADVAVLIVQHMPQGFTASFARRLGQHSGIPAKEAESGELLIGGRIYVAPGGRHMTLAGSTHSPLIRLDDTDPLWGVRPAADHLFFSAARYYGNHTVGVVLTGMGCDGAAGLTAIREVGGWAVVQDRESCVVPGMPDAARAGAGADATALPDDLAETIAHGIAVCRNMKRLDGCV